MPQAMAEGKASNKVGRNAGTLQIEFPKQREQANVTQKLGSKNSCRNVELLGIKKPHLFG